MFRPVVRRLLVGLLALAFAGDMWVSLGSGRVIQVETARQAGSKAGGVRVRYRDFDSAAIRISPPK